MAGKAGAVRAGRAYVELYADSSRFMAGIRQAESALKGFGSQLQSIGMKMAAMGAAAVTPFALSAKTFRSFEDEMLVVRAVTGQAGEEFEKLVKKAQLLGSTTAFNAKQYASAMAELARAGFTVKEIDDSIEPIANMARATGTDLAEATMYAASTLRSFGLSSDQMTRVVDVMTAAANRSAQTLSDLGEAMKYVAPTAHAFGMSIEDSAKSLGVLANFGIKGTMAGTSLRTIMVRLSNPAVLAKLKSLGVSVKDATGNFRDLAAIMRDIGAAIGKMSDVDQMSILYELFGTRAIGAGAKLTTAQFEELIQAVDNAGGTAARTAKIMDSGLGGGFRRLRGAIEGIGIAVGSAFAKPLTVVLDVIAHVSRQITDWVEKNQGLIGSLAAVSVVLLGSGMALIGMGMAIKAAAFGFTALRTITAAVAVPFKLLTALAGMLLNPLGLLATLSVGLGAAFVYMKDRGAAAVGALSAGFKTLQSDAIQAWEGIQAAYASGDLGTAMQIAWLTVKMEFVRGIDYLQRKWVDFKFGFVGAAYDAFYGALAAWEYVKYGISAGMTEAAAAATKAWSVFISWWKKAMEGTTLALAKMYNWMKTLTDKGWDSEGFMKAVQENFSESMSGIDIDLNERKRAAEERRQAARNRQNQELEKNLTGLAERRIQSQENIQTARDEELSKLGDELAAARKEWSEAIGRAIQNNKGEETLSRQEQMRRKMEEAAAASSMAFSEAMKTATATGTFSGSAAAGLGAGGLQQKIADATAATAKNTQKIADSVGEGSVFM